MTTSSRQPTCFIAMPITVHASEATLYGDPEHWAHVINHLFIPAIEAAGFQPLVPSASGTSMIHGRIVRHLVEADLVLCDLSQHNPNVLFELGVRTSLNRPVALVKDEHLGLPFDIQGLNTHQYSGSLQAWTIAREVEELTTHIKETVATSDGVNPLWQHFGIAIAAAGPSSDTNPLEAKVQVMIDYLEQSRAESEPLNRSAEGRLKRMVQDLILNGPIPIRKIRTEVISPGSVLAMATTDKTPSSVQAKQAELLMDYLARHDMVANLKHIDETAIAVQVSTPGRADAYGS